MTDTQTATRYDQIIGIAGPIVAGKSHLARALKDALGAERASFGSFVRDHALAAGLDDTRETLQAVGEQLLDELGAEEFTRRVLGAAALGGTIIVDGVRHTAVNEALLAHTGDYQLVFITCSRACRLERLRDRDPAVGDLDSLDSHSTEAELPQLAAVADIHVDGEATDATDDVLRRLSTRRDS